MDKPTCQNCYLSLFARECPGRGAKGMKPIIFIADSPTISDVKNNDVFTGRSNKLLREYINNYKLDYYSHLTNIIRCYCTETMDYYANKCKPNVINDIKLIKPTLIIPVGGFAYKQLKDVEYYNMKHIVNKPIAYANSIMIPIYSPAYIIKNKTFEEYDKSFKLISDIYAKLNVYYARLI